MTKEIFEFAFRLKETENQIKFSIFGVAVLVFAIKVPNFLEKKVSNSVRNFLTEPNLPAINKLELGTLENQTKFSHWLIIRSFKTMSFVESMEELLLVPPPVNMTLTSQPGKSNIFDFSSP